VEARAKPAEPEPAEPTEGSWDRAWRAVWEELKGLVRVERLDASDRALIAPEGRVFLRENLKLRLLHARLALLQRDEAAFRGDLTPAHGSPRRRFHPQPDPPRPAPPTPAHPHAAAVPRRPPPTPA